jgi:hypothetical protein
MDLTFLFYIFLSVVAITGGAFYFFTNRMEITAALYFVGILAAAVVFGLRWFSASGEVKLGNVSGTWPPMINYCPDFLTLYTVNNAQVCIDTIGVAQTGGIKKWDNPNQTDDSFLFNLFLDLSGPERRKKLCEEAATKRVTWEGVWDGSVCSGNEPPKPPANAPSTPSV